MANLNEKRTNRAEQQVMGKHKTNFATGQSMATDRQNPMHSNKKGQHHTSDDGARA